jgi:hypothetical protein
MKRLVKDKHSSLLGLFASDEVNKVDNIDNGLYFKNNTIRNDAS